MAYSMLWVCIHWGLAPPADLISVLTKTICDSAFKLHFLHKSDQNQSFIVICPFRKPRACLPLRRFQLCTWPWCISLKLLRKKTALIFEQRREDIQRWFGLMLHCFSLPHISLKSLHKIIRHTQRLIHWLHDVSCSHVLVLCSLSNKGTVLFMAW